jgi:thymidylate synthase
MKLFSSFDAAISWVSEQIEFYSNEVHAMFWQSTDVSNKPDMRMREVLNVSFQVVLRFAEELENYKKDIAPNIPWADDHFEERIGGNPLNPGETWRSWPWALSADRHRKNGKFSHTYMERYWPKVANKSAAFADIFPHDGIRYKYGDLNDVVDHLLGDPLSRQAYLPVWFPEDTGVVHKERVPCTLGYHFLQRNGHLHTTYYIRSCDFYRHFRDDLYLSLRLQLWILDQLRKKQNLTSSWNSVKPGLFTFHCVSMHMFVNDWNRMYGKNKS